MKPRSGTIAAAVLAGGATALLTAMYASGVNATARAEQFRSSNYLLKPAQAPVEPRPLSRATIQHALAVDPLSQNIFNTAVMQLGRSDITGTPDTAWFALLRHYGWRSTPALQNLLYYYAIRQQLGQVLDVVDALFRREKAMDQATAVLSLAETDPELRQNILKRLRTRPSWRHAFLMGSNVLTDPAAIEGRYQTLRALQRSGDRLPKAEMTALLPVLVKAGRAPDAFALWSYGQRGYTRPLNDTQFLQTAATIGQDDTATPFNWRLLAGDNFDVTPVGRGAPGITIHWSGQGVPVFVSQQTSGAAGNYRLRVAFNEEDLGAAKALGYRMMCNDTRVDFEFTGTPDSTHADWRTVAPVPCAFPRLETFGALAERRQDITVTLNGLSLRHE